MTRKTLLLLMIAVVLGLGWGLGRLPGGEAETERVALPEIVAAEVQKITISTLVDRLVIERRGGGWAITEPLRYPADPQLVGALLDVLDGAPEMDAEVDQGNLEDYGVDDQHALNVELWTEADTPALRVWIGKSAGPTSVFVRIPPEDRVFRAAIGARAAYERPAADWRDRAVLAVDPASVSGLLLERGGERLELSRKGEHWVLAGGPEVDDEVVEAALKILGGLRASRIHNPDYDAGLEQPAARVTLQTEAGSIGLSLGAREDGGAGFVRVDGRPDVYRVSAQARRVMLLPAALLRDRSLFRFDVGQVEELRLVDGGFTIVLQPAPDGGWAIVQPANMDADQEQVQRAVAALAELRAARIVDDASFSPGGSRLEVRLLGGATQALLFGERGRDEQGVEMVRVKVEGRPTVYELPVAALVELRRAFNRG